MENKRPEKYTFSDINLHIPGIWQTYSQYWTLLICHKLESWQTYSLFKAFQSVATQISDRYILNIEPFSLSQFRFQTDISSISTPLVCYRSARGGEVSRIQTFPRSCGNPARREEKHIRLKRYTFLDRNRKTDWMWNNWKKIRRPSAAWEQNYGLLWW